MPPLQLGMITYKSLTDMFQESKPEENQLPMSRGDPQSPIHDIVVFSFRFVIEPVLLRL